MGGYLDHTQFRIVHQLFVIEQSHGMAVVTFTCAGQRKVTLMNMGQTEHRTQSE